MAKRQLTCCVCADDAGRYEQHWNRDTGFGICRKCVDWLKNEKGVSDEEMLDLYGTEGVNYEEHEHQWGALEESRMAGTVHRKCQVPGCKAINACDDFDDDDDDYRGRAKTPFGVES